MTDYELQLGIGGKIDYDKRIDCAAIKMPDGGVWTGKRHGHCIATIWQATGKRAHQGVQGFVTMKGRFVDRKEAAMIAVYAGQVAGRTLPFELFSEDLY
jgi:hypothetical protein